MNDVERRAYHLEIKRLYEIIGKLQEDKVFLKNQLKKYQPKNQSNQVARLFLGKNQWN